MTASNSANQPAQDPGHNTVLQDQQIRLRRLGMASVSYCATLLLVFFFYHDGMLPFGVVIAFALTAICINLLFYLLISTNLNLKAADPTLAFPQIVCSILPTLVVLYFLEDGQARGVMLMLAVVAVSYGVMTLETGPLIRALLIMLAGYLVSLWLSRLTHSRVHVGSLEALQVGAVLIVSAQVIWLGSHINRLRHEVIERNRALKGTMAELHEALDTIQALATRDELTGLFNRRHLQTVLAQEVARAERDGQPFSVCLLDIDHFKQINDNYGHEGGDKVLRALAEAVQPNVRSVDCFGRFGGEEFLLILSATSLAGAQVKAEKLRQRIEALRFAEFGDAFRVTVSIGVAESDHEPSEATLRRADAGLYEAKNSGRNRVVVKADSLGDERT